MRGEGDKFDNTVEKFAEESGQEFTLVSLREIRQILRRFGFVEIEIADRLAWYLREATGELEKMRGPLQEQLNEQIEFWEVMVDALNQGAIMPGHFRAKKPMDTQHKNTKSY